MICSQNRLDNRTAPVATPAASSRAPRLHARPAIHTFIRTSPTGPLPRPVFVAQAFISPDQASQASDMLIQAATVAGGAAGMMQGKQVADRVKEKLALAALLLPRSTDSQRLDGTAAKGAEACYDAAAILTSGLMGAALMHALTDALPFSHLARF